ncbi:hypothetical protein H257_18569 [Aphanomyces astaci]|uniref:Uncharacterized protein n=1 Tax=Aphanomyces astaci TaxID=112090 RepID=W4FAQ0_APHAT|nr:hypothetical protein H257_18569 [Aphanomyces astaci]ETV64550.1 hypothetical protein H257_18569 [Aphanomyces astaci]|eukprot:XP_009845964.1 hypothetical protein H257_18569 [Aphanomyces astaci]
MPIDTFLLESKGDLSSSSVSAYNTPSNASPNEFETPSRRRSLGLRTPSTVLRRDVDLTQRIPDLSGHGKLFVMLDESNATHMNLVIKDGATKMETQSVASYVLGNVSITTAQWERIQVLDWEDLRYTCRNVHKRKSVCVVQGDFVRPPDEANLVDATVVFINNMEFTDVLSCRS